MMQSSSLLHKQPNDIDMNHVDLDWKTLRQAVLDAHKPLADVFFKGHGNHLQFIDSCIVKKSMLQFIKSDDAPVLLSQYSFIMHHAFANMGELEEAMRRAFHENFKKDISVDDKIGVLLPSSIDEKEWCNLSLGEQV